MGSLDCFYLSDNLVLTVFNNSSWISHHDSIIWNISYHNTSRTYHTVFSDFDTLYDA